MGGVKQSGVTRAHPEDSPLSLPQTQHGRALLKQEGKTKLCSAAPSFHLHWFSFTMSSSLQGSFCCSLLLWHPPVCLLHPPTHSCSPTFSPFPSVILPSPIKAWSAHSAFIPTQKTESLLSYIPLFVPISRLFTRKLIFIFTLENCDIILCVF